MLESTGLPDHTGNVGEYGATYHIQVMLESTGLPDHIQVMLESTGLPTKYR